MQAWSETGRCQRCHQRDGLPSAPWHPAHHALAPEGPAPLRRQGGRRAGFIEEDQVGGIGVGHQRPPGGPGISILLVGDQGLFLSVRPNRRSARPMVGTLTTTPWVPCHWTPCSASVASGKAVTARAGPPRRRDRSDAGDPIEAGFGRSPCGRADESSDGGWRDHSGRRRRRQPHGGQHLWPPGLAHGRRQKRADASYSAGYQTSTSTENHSRSPTWI